ncbi:cell division protein ZipA C-terminal FtsZ-binding domain-containing protein [Chitinibacteraceae bacterium HSL-7]
MDDLKLGLLIASGAVVGAVYGYNWWQEYRYRKAAQRAFARNEGDVLMDAPKNFVRQGERFEPSVVPADSAIERAEITPVQEAPAEVVAAPRVEPVNDAVADDDVLAESLLDPEFDFIVEIDTRDGVPIAARDVPPLPAPKRLVVLGRSGRDHWAVVQSNAAAQYDELRMGLQLADRQGALSAEQLNGFTMAVQQFADGIDATAVFPQRSAKLGAARELDEFCASVDVLIGLNLVSRVRPFAMQQVRVLAERAGLVRQGEQYVYQSDSGKTLFTLANQDQSPLSASSDALTLLFDVPRVAGGVNVFDYLTEFAQSLAGQLGAALVDDNGRELTAASLARIRNQLVQLYAQMDDRGVVPGSVAALRLFA